MSPHAEEPTTNGDMSNDSAPLTNGETPQSRVLSVCLTPQEQTLHNNVWASPIAQSVSLTAPHVHSYTATHIFSHETPTDSLKHLHSYPVVHDSVEFYKSNPYGAKSLTLFHNTYNSFIAPLHPYLKTPYSYISPYLTRADELGDSSLNKLDHHVPLVKEDTTKLKELAFSPLTYLQGTYQDEYKKTQGPEGLIKTVKAGISTELKVAHDAFTFAVEYWNKGKQQASKKVEEVKQ